MQPYFFPYLGYFDLIDKSDRWIVFDVVQYIRHGWMNRNRILHPQSGWQYIIGPLKKHESEALIKDVEYNDAIAWRQKILRQLGHYRRAPHYETVMDLVSDGLAYPEASVSRLNAHLLEGVCRYLGIGFDYTFLSEMDLPIGEIAGPGDWALQIAKAVGAEEYINPPGGRGLFDPLAFERAGIRLTIRNMEPMAYTCRGYEFHPGLSIIDLMMWNDPQSIVRHLRGTEVSPRL
jgi:hypothetical protein